jgi:hypothetical protein
MMLNWKSRNSEPRLIECLCLFRRDLARSGIGRAAEFAGYCGGESLRCAASPAFASGAGG